MKNSYLLVIIIAISLASASCGKQNNTANSLSGKWQETKIVISEDSLGAILHDTTYLQPLTAYDYAQFNSSGMFSLGADHYYYPNSPGEPKTPQAIPPIVSTFTYTPYGTKYVLASTEGLNPGGFIVADTITFINPNSILLHSVFYANSPFYKLITDSYYLKQ